MINEYFMTINRIWWPRYATARHMTTFNFQNMTVLFRILCKLHSNSRDIKNKSAIIQTHAGRNLTQCSIIVKSFVVNICNICDLKLPPLANITYISLTVSGQTQSNKLVYWETRIVWIIENIFWSDQWPWTNKQMEIKQKLASDLQKISAELDSCVRFWSQHSHDEEHGWGVREAKYFCNYFFSLCSGFLNCLSADGSVYDTTKYCWLQGRWVKCKRNIAAILVVF